MGTAGQRNFTAPGVEVLVGKGWLFQRSHERTLALQLNSSEQVVLSGELHRALWSTPDQLKAYTALIPAIETIAAAATTAEREPTIGAILRGTGWEHLFLELTGRCNERCVHCYASSSPEVTAALSRSLVLSLVDEAAALGFSSIQFTGGDALLSPHLLEGVKRAAQHHIPQIEVYTNGLALKPQLATELAQFQVKMAFSVYSHRVEVHDAITRTPGSLRRTLQAIEWARQAGMTVRVGVTLTQDNLDDEDGVVALLSSRGVDRDHIGVDRERPVGRGSWREPNSGNAEQATATMHALASRAEGGGKLAVTYDGRVVPCVFDREQTLGQVNAGDAFNLRRILSQRVVLNNGAITGRARLKVVGEALACDDCQSRRYLLASLQLEPGLPVA